MLQKAGGMEQNYGKRKKKKKERCDITLKICTWLTYDLGVPYWNKWKAQYFDDGE